MLSTVVLLVTYALVVMRHPVLRRYRDQGHRPAATRTTQGDVLSVLGHSVFGTSGFGSVLTHLLLLMVLSSAAASTQTTILPTARTTLSMAVYKAIPSAFARIQQAVPHPDGVDGGHGGRVDRPLRDHELPSRRAR